LPKWTFLDISLNEHQVKFSQTIGITTTIKAAPLHAPHVQNFIIPLLFGKARRVY